MDDCYLNQNYNLQLRCIMKLVNELKKKTKQNKIKQKEDIATNEKQTITKIK